VPAVWLAQFTRISSYLGPYPRPGTKMISSRLRGRLWQRTEGPRATALLWLDLKGESAE
jgi:hypothetical protein